MFLARIKPGAVQVYALVGSRPIVKVWRFCSYGIGVAAIAATKTDAVVMARAELNRNKGVAGTGLVWLG